MSVTVGSVGLMVTALTTGSVFSTLTLTLPLAVLPLPSVTVTLQEMLSVGLLVLLVKARLLPVPSVVLPFCQV